MGVAGLVLAAGAGRRYGMPKALVGYGGKLLVQRAAATLREAGCQRVVVVLGAAADRVRAAAPDLPETVVNPDWPSGMGSSLRAGLASLMVADGPGPPGPPAEDDERGPGGQPAEDNERGPGGQPAEIVVPGRLTGPHPVPGRGWSGPRASGESIKAAVVLLVDMPGITAEAVRRVSALASPSALVMGGYDGRRGHPVLLGREHWAGVAELATGDRGARDYLRAHADLVRVVPVGDVAEDFDLDEPVGPGPGGSHA